MSVRQLETKVVPKAWGSELILDNNELYCGKILRFNPGASFSLHYHMLKTESWYVLSGSFQMVTVNTEQGAEEQRQISKGDAFHVERGAPHQLVAGPHGGQILEVSTQHFDTDSYRIRRGQPHP